MQLTIRVRGLARSSDHVVGNHCAPNEHQLTLALQTRDGAVERDQNTRVVVVDQKGVGFGVVEPRLLAYTL